MGAIGLHRLGVSQQLGAVHHQQEQVQRARQPAQRDADLDRHAAGVMGLEPGDGESRHAHHGGKQGDREMREPLVRGAHRRGCGLSVREHVSSSRVAVDAIWISKQHATAGQRSGPLHKPRKSA